MPKLLTDFPIQCKCSSVLVGIIHAFKFRMKNIILIALMFSLSGCATADMDRIINELTIRPHKIKEEPIIENEEPTVKCNGKCGYATTRSFDEKDEFFKECKTNKLTKKKCLNNFLEMIDSRLAIKYPSGNFKYAYTWCKSEPKLCDVSTVEGANAFEEKLEESHNSAVASQESQKRAEIEKEKNAERRERIRTWGMFMATQNRNRVNCTTTSWGNTINTNCY